VVGVRPEDVHRIDAFQTPHSLQLSATVELVEAIGNEAFIHARIGSWPIIVRSTPTNLPEAGAQIALRVGPERLHFFDAASGARLQSTAGL
jgi:ABC-type sugar transport system ATPase subunit